MELGSLWNEMERVPDGSVMTRPLVLLLAITALSLVAVRAFSGKVVAPPTVYGSGGICLQLTV